MTSHNTIANIQRFSPRRLVVAFAALALLASGCAGNQTPGTVKYSVSAQKNYEQGLEELKEKDWLAAAKYFSFIKARFPYSKYAVLAELRLADAEFGAGNHLRAIDAYKLFIKFHPTHDLVSSGYVQFRIGESYVAMLPSDFWLIPPAHEKDQSATVDAERELKSFVRKYPRSKHVDKAKDLLAKVSLRLARHEWYVANFYWERGKPMGTVLRLRRLLERYPGAGYDGEALWLLGQAYIRVEMPDRARKAWQKLIDKHPSHRRASDARSALTTIAG